MESDASTSPRRRSTSCYSDSGDSSCSEPFSECGSDDLSFTPAAGIHRLLLSCASEASEDAISSLVAELERPSPSLDSLRRAAMELRLLAKHNPDNRVRIAAAGGVRPLVRLLAHADPLLQEHGVTALLNLSLCDENKAAIIEAGAIRPLVRALKSAASPAARENAACALLRLSQLDGASAAAIGRAGALPLLVSLLETGGARGKKDAATALYALCSGARENRQRAVEAGAVRPLLDLMADPESGMVDKAAYVLHSLLGSGDGRAAAVEEGGIPVLVEMVEVGTSRQKEIATLCLLQICEDNAVYRTMVAREGAIPPLVALSQSSSARTKLKTKVHTHTRHVSHYSPHSTEISNQFARLSLTRKLMRFRFFPRLRRRSRWSRCCGSRGARASARDQRRWLRRSDGLLPNHPPHLSSSARRAGAGRPAGRRARVNTKHSVFASASECTVSSSEMSSGRSKKYLVSL
jgi:hypothetical protein